MDGHPPRPREVCDSAGRAEVTDQLRSITPIIANSMRDPPFIGLPSGQQAEHLVEITYPRQVFRPRSEGATTILELCPCSTFLVLERDAGSATEPST